LIWPFGTCVSGGKTFLYDIIVVGIDNWRFASVNSLDNKIFVSTSTFFNNK
jgi:hypothetical protein